MTVRTESAFRADAKVDRLLTVIRVGELEGIKWLVRRGARHPSGMAMVRFPVSVQHLSPSDCASGWARSGGVVAHVNGPSGGRAPRQPAGSTVECRHLGSARGSTNLLSDGGEPRRAKLPPRAGVDERTSAVNPPSIRPIFFYQRTALADELDGRTALRGQHYEPECLPEGAPCDARASLRPI